MRFLRIFFLAVSAILAAGASRALACSVCYGNPNSLMTKGLNMGIFCLLVVVLAVLGSFGAFFLHIRKRSRQSS